MELQCGTKALAALFLSFDKTDHLPVVRNRIQLLLLEALLRCYFSGNGETQSFLPRSLHSLNVNILDHVSVTLVRASQVSIAVSKALAGYPPVDTGGQEVAALRIGSPHLDDADPPPKKTASP